MSTPVRESIKTSFLKLLEERPLRDISVKDIVQECGVNRNSFYYHFRDLPALLEETVTEQIDRVIAAQGPAVSLAECLETVAGLAAEHRQMILHISQSTHRDSFDLHLMRICRRVVEDYAAAAFGTVELSAEDREILVRFYQCECFGQVTEWLNHGMRYDIRAQFRRLCQLGEGMTELLLHRAAPPREPAGTAQGAGRYPVR